MKKSLEEVVDQLDLKPYYFSCPSCANKYHFEHVRENTSNTGCLLYFFGSLPALLIWGSRVNNRVMCSNCKYIFQQPNIPLSRIASFTMWILLLLILAILATTYGVFTTGTPISIGKWINLPPLADFIRNNPEATAFGILVFLSLIIPTCLIGYLSSNYKYRKQLRKEVNIDVYSRVSYSVEIEKRNRQDDSPWN